MNAPAIRSYLHVRFDKHGAPWVDGVQLRNNRIDMILLVDGVLTGIEIKSDF
jgi:hypothetical protein